MKKSIVTLQKVKESSKQFRFDAEYFKPDYLQLETIIKKKKYYELRDYITILTDYHANGSYENLRNNVTLLTEPNYAYMVRTVDLERDDYENDVIYVDEHAYNFLTKSKVLGTEVIINKIGNAGKAYIIPPLDKKMTLGMNQFMIRANRKTNNLFLYVYLICKYGSLQLEQRVTGAVPLSIDKESVKSVYVPELKDNFQKTISIIVEKYFELKADSKQKHIQAQSLLLSELGLENWKPKHELSFIRNYSETEEVKRFDAEYFQPYYDEVERKVFNDREYKTLESLCSQINYGTVPTSPYTTEGVSYIKGLNLIDGFIDGGLDCLIKCENLSRKFFVKENDIVISQMGTVGKAGIVEKEQSGYLFASFTIRIRLKDSSFIDPYVLTLYINDIARPYFLLRKIAQASVRQNTDLPTIKNLNVPSIDKKVQEKISNCIKLSRQKGCNSKSLLEIAKKGVEMAIEKDEETAEKWMKEEIKQIGVEL